MMSLLSVAIMLNLAASIETKHTLSPVPAGLDGAEFELWIPDTLPADRPVRGVLGSSHYHAGASVYDAPEWRTIATRHEFAILRYKITSGGNPIDTSVAGAKALLRGLEELAKLARRQEIAFAGIIPTGLSWGAMQVCSYTSFIPDRIIAAVPFRATAGDIRLAASSDASRRVPLLHLSAGRERFEKYKPHESVEAFAGMAATGARFAMLVQPGEEHHVLGDLSFLQAWLEEVISLRLPAKMPLRGPVLLAPVIESGWGGTFEVKPVSKDPWKGGDAMVGVNIGSIPKGGKSPPWKTWLPSRRLAQAWRSYAETGSTGILPPFVLPPGGRARP